MKYFQLVGIGSALGAVAALGYKTVCLQNFYLMNNYLVNIKGISASYQRQVVGALKLFYKEIHRRDIPFEYLKVTQRENKLPVVLIKMKLYD